LLAFFFQIFEKENLEIILQNDYEDFMFVKHKMEVSAFTFKSYKEKTTDLLQQKELKRTDRKKTQRKRL
jgi:hypothetical protein